MARLAIASAIGFRVQPERFVTALLAVSGFVLKRIESQGRKVRGRPESIIATGLQSQDREVGFDLLGRDRNEWGYLSASTTKVPKVDVFDILEVNWPSDLDHKVVESFALLCEKAFAEFGYLDETDPFPNFRLYTKLPFGIPGVASVMWVGKQLARFQPSLVSKKCWHTVEYRELGYLLRAGDFPVSLERKAAIVNCIGQDAFAPRKEPWPFDLSKKNVVTPDWVRQGVVPELPPGMRVIGVIPGKGEPSKK